MVLQLFVFATRGHIF